MRASISQGQVNVVWNDLGPNEYQVIVAENLTYTIRDEQTLRDLHACLDFLYGRPKTLEAK